jgi:triosephosphate isomerase
VFALGAQDVSAFGDGAYTGEVSARQIKELADWVIIGHSERRKYFSETDELLAKKEEQAKSAGLKIIYCVPNDSTDIPKGVDVVAYEPVWAIGTGKSDTPENANAVIATIKATSQVPVVLYGGSVTAANVASFVGQPSIDGVLAGGASLDPVTFSDLIGNA